MEAYQDAVKTKLRFFKKKNHDDMVFEPKEKKKGKTKAGLAALIIAVLAKSKVLILFLIKVMKLDVVLQIFKLGSMGGTLVSMALMAWVYASSYGWYFAVGFVALIFIHEMGHFLVAREEGVEVSAPVFIPFFGAFISMKGKPGNAEIEGKIAIAGPLAGTLATFMAAAGWMLTANDLLKGLVYINLIITLFNLIPFGFMDGGRVASAISGKFGIVGLVMFGVLAVLSHNPLLLILFIFGTINVWKMRKKDRAADPYYDIDESSRNILSVTYFGTLIVNGAALMAFIAMEQGLPLFSQNFL